LEEHPEEDLVGLDSHKCLTEMEEDGDVEDTIEVEVEVLNAMVSEHPIEEVTRRRGEFALHESREHWDLVWIFLHQIRITSGDAPQIHLLSWRNPLLIHLLLLKVLSLQLHLFPLFRRIRCSGGGRQ
jgi:hypothetical protein